MKTWLWIAGVAALSGACAQVPPEMQVVNDAAAALGGKDRIQAVKTLIIEGEGSAPNVGQNRMPDGELPVWKVTEFKRSVDLANGRMRMQQLRTAQFLFAGATMQRQDQGLDGDIAYNVGQDGTATRAGEAAARDRRIEMLHHPITIVRAALDPAAKVTNLRQQGSDQVVDVDHREGRHADAGRRRRHQTAVARDVDGRQRQPGRRRHRHGVLRIRGRERTEAAEAADDEHRQVRAVRSSGVEKHRRRRRRRPRGAGSGEGGQCHRRRRR